MGFVGLTNMRVAMFLWNNWVGVRLTVVTDAFCLTWVGPSLTYWLTWGLLLLLHGEDFASMILFNISVLLWFWKQHTLWISPQCVCYLLCWTKSAWKNALLALDCTCPQEHDGVFSLQPLDYTSYRSSGSRVSSRAGSARASPVVSFSSSDTLLATKWWGHHVLTLQHWVMIHFRENPRHT